MRHANMRAKIVAVRRVRIGGGARRFGYADVFWQGGVTTPTTDGLAGLLVPVSLRPTLAAVVHGSAVKVWKTFQ